MLTFSMAVEDVKKPDDGETEWLRVILYGELAEEMAPRLLKGQHVYVEGRTRLNKWVGADGAERSGLQLMAWVCQPLGQIGRRRPRPAREPLVTREHDLIPF